MEGERELGKSLASQTTDQRIQHFDNFPAHPVPQGKGFPGNILQIFALDQPALRFRGRAPGDN
jgi:hypothetical protein